MLNEEIAAILAELLPEIHNQADGSRLSAEELLLHIEHPAASKHGDYSTNIALQLAKLLKRSPLSIANEMKDRLAVHPAMKTLFVRIEVAPPGFINLFVNWEQWAARELGVPASAASASGGDSVKAIIEHTSINPNKSAHIGHLRNSCIGDTLARMLKRTGCRVEVHNYIDDLGNQLADTMVGLLQTSTDGEFARFGDFCWETYAKINKAYKENPELLKERTAVLHELEKGNSNMAWLGLVVAERIVKEHLEEMGRFGIHYDVLVWESSIIREGFWTQAFELLRKTSVFRQETEGKLAGCWVLRQPGSQGGLDHPEDPNGPGNGSSLNSPGSLSGRNDPIGCAGQEERNAAGDGQADFQADKVLVRSNGILTYTAKDIAYHLWKFGVLGKDFRYRKFADRLWSTSREGVRKGIGRADLVINVIDHRQEYPQTMVKQALAALGFAKQAEQLRHVSYGVVHLSPDTARGLGLDTSDGRSSYPMSGRQGIGIKVADILHRMEQVIDSKRSRKAGISSLAVAAASIRYYLLRFHLQTEVVFDLEQATEVTGNTGVYLLYSYARAWSILEKSGVEAVAAGEPLAWNRLEDQEHSLLRHIAYWPETLHEAVRELAPHQICSYLHELSTLFNHFYAVCPILKADSAKKSFRLWLTGQFRETMQDGLEILGLPAPKGM
ncbi:MAG: arginine--tRNA ligase [Paenibacillaceae bacterium]|jgi:arginyl-tRNA synthetase|nr:arginine--tRNA ligase [Paenibacillaceae bacterium]